MDINGAAKLFFDCVFNTAQTNAAVDIAGDIVKLCGIAHFEYIWQMPF